MNNDCFFCGGSQFWEGPCGSDKSCEDAPCGSDSLWDYFGGEKSLYCPFCLPSQAEHQALSKINLSTWHSAAWPQLEAKHYGPRFQTLPWLLVIHSGSRSPNVAEFFNKIGEVYYKSKKRWVKVSAHISWSGKKKCFVQCVPFSHVAWHCGGSRFRGNRRLNFCSIGIELPGPWNKPRDSELRLLRETVDIVTHILPLKVAVRHSDIDPRKKDPGPGFEWSSLEGLGLELPFRS